MNKTVTSIGAQADAPQERFSTRHFLRLVGLVRANRAPLSLGLLSTLAFACLHTVSIGAAFPIFKILLEDEGLRGWVDRTAAGRRLGVHFAPATDPDGVRLLRVNPDRAAYRAGFRAGDLIRDVRGRPVAQLLHELANGPAGESIAVRVGTVEPGTPRLQPERSFHPGPIEKSTRLMLWSASLLPDETAQGKWRALTYLLVGLVVVVVAANAFRYTGEVLIAKAVLSAMLRLRGDLYERTLHLPMSFFADRPTADLVGRFVQDIQEIQRGLLTLFSKFIREPLRAVLILGLAFALDWRITLTMVVVGPVAALVFWRIGRRVKRSNRKLLSAYGEMIGALTASLQNLRVVKAFTAEARERDRLRQVDSRVFRQQLKLARLQAFVSPAMETVAVVAAGAATLWLASRVLDHDMSVSQFATLGVTLSLLFDPLRKLSDVYVRVQRSTAGAERIFQVIDHPVESDAGVSGVELKPLERGIDYVHVSFTYPAAAAPAVRDVSLSIHRGETVALVGPNGCGKTTLVSLLLRLFDPETGEIRYDGVDLRRATLRSLRRQVGLVSQDAVVFAGTPVDNIAYGSSVGDLRRVEEAARLASADEFLSKLNGGYRSVLAERGTSLSGGQRQRLAVARAIYRDAPILIFDEATSQVDSESEGKIQAALRQFARDHTTIIVAHRLSTIQFADRIIVMDAGRIIDTGTQKALFDRCSLFRTLCETQLAGGIADS